MLDAIIVGGGIGGLTLALFCQAEGLKVQVFEAAPALSEVGAGITVPPNGMQVLARLGLDAQVRSAGAVLPRGDGWDVKAGRLSEFDLTPFEASLGQPMVGIHRGRLQSILVDALEPGILRLGARGKGFTQGPGGVELTLENGEVIEGRCLIGADGLRSVIRGQLFPERQPRFSKQICWRGLMSEGDLSEAPGITREIWGGRVRLGFLPIGGGQYYWFAVEAAESHTSGRPEEEKAHLEAIFKDFPAPVPEMLRHTPPGSIIRTDIYDLPPEALWHKGKVALMGDAAHSTTPNLGQGGAQALEDGCVLAGCLAKHSGDPEAAFGEFEAIRGEKALGVVRQSWQFGKMAHWQNPILRWLRNWMMRLTPPSVINRQMDALYRLNF